MKKEQSIFSKVAILVLLIMLLSWLLGIAMNYLVYMIITGYAPDKLVSPSSTGWTMAFVLLESSLFLARIHDKVDRMLFGVKRKRRTHRRMIVNGKNMAWESSHKFNASIASRVMRKMDRGIIKGTPALTDREIDYGVISLPLVTFSPSNEVAIRASIVWWFLQKAQDREAKYQKGQGLSRNYWTKNVKRSKSVMDKWRFEYYYSILACIDDAQNRLPDIIRMAREQYPSIITWDVTPPTLIYWVGNHRKLTLSAIDTFRILLAWHYNDPKLLWSNAISFSTINKKFGRRE